MNVLRLLEHVRSSVASNAVSAYGELARRFNLGFHIPDGDLLITNMWDGAQLVCRAFGGIRRVR